VDARLRIADATASRTALVGDVTLLHCTSSYPAPPDSVNLEAMNTLRERFGLPIGYSDHTEGTAVAIAAVALGASIVEKHLTLDRQLSGPDHAASLDPDEFSALVHGIRTVEQARGTAAKVPADVEADVRAVARRSLVTARDLSPGRVIVEDDLIPLRPGGGLPPSALWDHVGRSPSRTYRAGEPFEG
jgi:sialic acid synthase SpsE